MIFPPDSEIREYSAYYIRAIKIFREKFRNENGKEPSEFEIQDFSKMGIIPFGILKQQNGKKDADSIMDIVKEHSELSIEGDKIVMKKKIEPVDVFYEVRDELEKRGWKYVKPKQIGGAKWEPGYFEMKEGAKA